jgi:16S rRNA (cytidine1402-2'-O)-methyltransferase
MSDATAGILFVVATPIGNLEDMSLRAARVLREADFIAAEDTRHTAKLLHHFDIRRPMFSLHEHNELEKVPVLVAKLLGGARIAFVTDAGTPAVSDPGYRLVRAAIDAGIRVEPIPGPSALLAALVVSGLPTDGFVFAGFPPPKSGARTAWLETLADERRTLVFFEAPHRIRETLEAALAVLGDREVSLGRELTKLHEEIIRGRLSIVLDRLTDPRGEFTVVVSGKMDVADDGEAKASDSQLLTDFGHLTETGMGRREAIGELARRYRLRSREVFSAIDRARRP